MQSSTSHCSWLMAGYYLNRWIGLARGNRWLKNLRRRQKGHLPTSSVPEPPGNCMRREIRQLRKSKGLKLKFKNAISSQFPTNSTASPTLNSPSITPLKIEKFPTSSARDSTAFTPSPKTSLQTQFWRLSLPGFREKKPVSWIRRCRLCWKEFEHRGQSWTKF